MSRCLDVTAPIQQLCFHRLTGKHALADTEFLVDAYGYLIAHPG